jgi:hypothetical protein
MDMGELLTRWTIRLALVCYVAVLAGGIARVSQNGRWMQIARAAWTLGCLLFLAHVACAFQYYHGWSHTHAFDDTARQTKELIGWQFGAGIYFSYLFTLLWTADAAWWWLAAASYASRSRLLGLSIHAYMLFIAFNGAIIFEGGPTRWVGIAASLGLLLLLGWRILGTKRVPARITNKNSPGAQR